MTKSLFDTLENTPSAKPSPEEHFHALESMADEMLDSVRHLGQQAPAGDATEALLLAGEQLAQNMLRLQTAVEALTSRPPAFQSEDIQKQSGIEEAKLLASLEKWQRRYTTLELEQKTLAAAYAELQERARQVEEENELLRHALTEEQVDAERQRGIHQQIAMRLEHSLSVIDKVLE